MSISERALRDAVTSSEVVSRVFALQGCPGVLSGPGRLRVSVAAALPLLLLAGQAGAFGLGPAQVRSSLGAPLHVQIPVNAGSLDEIGCITIGDNGDLPVPSRARAEAMLLPGGNLVIDITTSQPAQDPALGFSVSAGCQSVITRGYTLFLDPPASTPDLPALGSLITPGLSTIPMQGASAARRRRTASADVGAAGIGGSANSTGTDTPALVRPPRRVKAPVGVAAPSAPAGRAHQLGGGFTPQSGSVDNAGVDRFHLSTDIGTDLRLSDELGIPDAAPVDPQQLQSLKDARAKLAAILAGQDPSTLPSPKDVELQGKIDGMSAEIAALHQQLAVQAEHTKDLEAARSSGALNYLFGAVALLAALIAGWFFVRYRRSQTENMDQPWWEQSQLANVTERGGDETPFAVHGGGLYSDSIMVEPEVLDHDTFIQTTRMNKSPFSPGPSTVPLGDNEPDTMARGPATVPRPQPPTLVPVPAPAIQSMVSPLAPVNSANTIYTESKVSSGTLDERIDVASPKPLDFNLDLPPVTNYLGNDDRGVAATGSLQSGAAERPTELAPLDFELPRGLAESEPVQMGPDTILRLDDQDNEQGVLLSASESDTEQASVQFRLIQFTSVIEQAKELDRTHEPTKSIATLRQYVLRDETIPTLMWLMLFGLYKQVNKRPVYDALGEHFSRRYKRPMARWDESLQSIAPQTPLASLPELDAAIRAKWGTQAGIEMLRTLTCGRDQPNEIIFNAALQRDLLQMAKIFPLNDSD